MVEVKKKRAGGPPSAAIAAIKQRQAAMKAMEEAQRAEEEAERLAEEEERKRQEAEAETAREAKERKKEKERLKKEALKKEGKYQTKAEKEKMERTRLKLAQLLQSGVNLNTPTTGSAEMEGKKEKPVYKRKTGGGKKTFGTGPKNAHELALTGDPKMLDGMTTQLGDLRLDAPLEDEAVPDNWDDLLGSSSSDSSDTDSSEEDVPQLDVNSASPKPDSVPEGAPVGPLSSEMAKDDEPGNDETEELRSPICCVLGHVDTGKTKLLDKIRQTSVQEGEAGGITQQIGATYFPIEAILAKTACLGKAASDYRVPGLLVIDTPGHESFSNLRSRGSSLCNIAVLVVDLMHGLEAQTLESIQLLKLRKTPFVVALNKIDRLYGWQATSNGAVQASLALQSAACRDEFEARVQQTKLAFAELGLNAELFWANSDVRRTVHLVPTSAITGEGIPDLLALLVELTQTRMAASLTYVGTTLECTVLEVKVVEGFGTTIDVILSNGRLAEGDRIALCGLNGPIVTTVRALLTPQPLKELRVKGAYVHHKSVRAALGVKISAPDLDKAVPGSRLLRLEPGQDEAGLAAAVMADLEAILGTVDATAKGVAVQASTLGSLEALLSFLADMKIPVAAINIGPVHKRDVIKTAVMLEQGAPEYAVMLCFDVKVEKDALDFAQEAGVRIFQADIIYHLFDQFSLYMATHQEQKKKNMVGSVVFPCQLRIVPGCVFNKRDPIICGVDVVEGILRIGTPLCVPPSVDNGFSEPLRIGKVTSIELNHKPVDSVKKGSPSVAIKIEPEHLNDTPKMVGRHFMDSEPLISRMSRTAIDLLKEHFRDELSKDDWNFVRKLKSIFNIP